MSQQKAWDCPECGKKGIHKKGVYLLGLRDKVCVPCANRIIAERKGKEQREVQSC